MTANRRRESKRDMSTFEQAFTVKTYDCHPDGRVKIYALLQYLQEAAAVHAEQLGFGYEKLTELDCYWVLSDLRAQIIRLPRWNEHALIKTWPSGHSRSVATREFVVVDGHGERLLVAASQWMVLSRTSGRPRNLLRLGLDLPASGQKVFPDEIDRLGTEGDYSVVEQLTVPHSALDMNGHVNNAEYVRWAFDALQKGNVANGVVRSVHVTYLREVFETDELELSVRQDVADYYRVREKKLESDEAVFVMEVGC